MQFRLRALGITAPLATLTVACVHTDVPRPLDKIESAAETAYDRALAADPHEVAHEAETIRQTWSGYRASAVRAGAAPETVSGVDEAVDGLCTTAKRSADPVTLARSANAVTRWLGKLYGLYHPPAPPAVADLDYLGRDLAIDGRAGDMTHATTTLAALDAAWQNVRPRLRAIGASLTARKYEETLGAMRTAVASRDLVAVVRHAEQSLEVVDVMETVLEQSTVD